MRRTPLTLALAFAGALSFAAIAGAQTDQAGGAGQSGAGQSGGQSGTSAPGAGGGQAGTGVGSGTQTGSTTGDTGSQAGSASARSSSNANSDQKYLDQVAIGNLAEIQMSQLAVQNAQDPQVKQFAQQMVDAHTKANEQLQQVASGAGVTLPTDLDAKHQKMQSKLQGQTGANFDREYMKLMVASHKEMEGLLKKKAGKTSSASASSSYGGSSSGNAGAAGTSGTSGTATGTSGTSTDTTGTTGTSGSAVSSGAGADVNSLASQLLPQVQQHLQEAKDIEKQLGKGNKNNSGGNSAK